MSEETSAPKEPDPKDIHLGKRLRYRRRLLGMTQQQLGEQTGVKFQQIQKYECGANKISASRLHDFCTALQVDSNYFYDGIDGQFNEQAAARDSVEMTRAEINLLAAFRKASPKAQRAFLDLMNASPSPDEQ